MVRRKTKTSPVVIIAVVAGGQNYSDIGTELPHDPAVALSLMRRALYQYVDSVGDITPQGIMVAKMAKAIGSNIRDVELMLLKRRNAYYHEVLMGVGVRSESLSDTIRQTKKRRNQHGDTTTEV